MKKYILFIAIICCGAAVKAQSDKQPYRIESLWANLLQVQK